jgi:hypothetical protein
VEAPDERARQPDALARDLRAVSARIDVQDGDVGGRALGRVRTRELRAARSSATRSRSCSTAASATASSSRSPTTARAARRSR